MKFVSMLIKIVILLALLFVAVKNTQSVDFSYALQRSVHWPLIVLLLIFFVLGAIFGMMSMLGRILRLRSEVARLRADVRKNGRINEKTMTTSKPVTYEPSLPAEKTQSDSNLDLAPAPSGPIVNQAPIIPEDAKTPIPTADIPVSTVTEVKP